jgi:hypothetical protein
MDTAPRPLYGVTDADESCHGRYLSLVSDIERRFDVARWRCGDVDIWPLARMDLYLDMHWQHTGQSPPRPRAYPLRVASRTVRPLLNFWKSRRDLSHLVTRPGGAHAIVLGDGVSLDWNGDAWVDRFAEPIIAALEKQGHKTVLMQNGNLERLPWQRPTFAANRIEARGWLAGHLLTEPAVLPDHERVVQFLSENGVEAPSLSKEALLRRARTVSATASAFERVLKTVRPKFAFIVTYYAHLGQAFALACRRQGILSVDLQHNPQEGAHKAYLWERVPRAGYRTLPALFWNWTRSDAANIGRWAVAPWHFAIHGGHPQLAPFLDDDNPATRAWDAKYREASGGAYAREVLVALQPIGGQRATWDALAAQIEASPTIWRWWIRRHPAAHSSQDAVFGRLPSLQQPNVVIDAAQSLPLPALLRHMDAVVSLASGAGAEAAMFGVPSLFLSDEARAMFPALLASGQGTVVEAADVNAALGTCSASTDGPQPQSAPDIDATLLRIEELAERYAQLCRIAEPIGDRRMRLAS